MIKRLLLVGWVLLLVACGGGEASPTSTLPPAALPSFAEVNAQIIPVREADLSFQVDGQLAEWLVEPGETVVAGQALARIDTRLLDVKVSQAEAALAQAQAELAKLQEGAQPADIAAAQARVNEAEGQLDATVGAVSASDLSASRAGVAAARARLSQLLSGPEQDVVQTALTRREQAQAALAQARLAAEQTAANASAAKTRAAAAIEEAANQVRAAQDRYSTAYWQNQRAQEGFDPVSNAPLNDFGKQQYQDAFNAAQRQLSDSERALELARLAYEQALQEERSANQLASEQIASAEADLAAAEAAWQKLLAGAKQSEVATARAELAAAEAELARLIGDQRKGEITVAESNVAAAEAELARVTQGATAADIAKAQAGIAVAQALLDEARLRRELATLTAPFAGTIGQYLVEVGEQVHSGAQVLSLGDTSRWQIETDDLSELEVGRLQVGQEFKVTVDALPGETFTARLVRVNPQPNVQRGEITYVVLLDLLEAPANVRWGMSARIFIPLASEG